MKKGKHLLFILILFCTAGLLERIVFLSFDELRRQPIVINKFLQIYPVYNQDGTWLHGKIGIGYVSWLLYFESILSLFLLIVMIRYMDLLTCFFGLSQKWFFIMDIGIAPALYRIFTTIRRAYTLDYLQIKQMVYDFPDLCIGVFVIGILVWAILLSFIFYKYNKEKRKEMSFKERLVWGVQFRQMLFRVFFLPRIRWEEEFKQWKRKK